MISVEAHTMINSEHPPGAGENVAALAISIVDQDVEDGEQPEVSNIGVDHRHRAIVRIKAFHGCKPAVSGHGRAWNKIDVGRLVDVDPHLKRPGPERPVGQHRDRHAVEAADPGHLVRGHLPEAEGAVREVPERTLSLQRLVDAFDGFAVHRSSAKKVAFDACSRRPVICSSACPSCTVNADGAAERHHPRSGDQDHRQSMQSVEQRPTVAVGPRANVPMRIHRLQAERT